MSSIICMFKDFKKENTINKIYKFYSLHAKGVGSFIDNNCLTLKWTVLLRVREKKLPRQRCKVNFLEISWTRRICHNYWLFGKHADKVHAVQRWSTGGKKYQHDCPILVSRHTHTFALVYISLPLSSFFPSFPPVFFFHAPFRST